MTYSIDLRRYRAFLENGQPLCGKALLNLEGLPMSQTQPSTFQPAAALQVSKLFWRTLSDFAHVYTEAPNPASSSTTPSLGQ